jgi:hypothetical protein
MENTVEKMKAEFEAFLKDNEKFEKGNATAGTRARKALAELTKLAKARRGEITAEKHARKEAK